MTVSPPERAGSRRALLAAGAAAVAGGTLIAGCGGSGGRHRRLHRTSTVEPVDIPILNGLLELENYAIAGYAAGTPLLSGRAAKAATLFLSQELAHAGSLTVLIRRAGGTPPEPPPSYDLGRPTGAAELLSLLHRLESRLLAAYLDAIPRLTPGHLRGTAAAIFANDAQHLAILRSELGLVPDPAALVTGGE